MWGVPVDHEMFSDINPAQWMWYFNNFMEDKEESFNSHRDLVEYHASFIEPDAVRKIREARDSAIEVPHDEFVAGIEHMFGRKIDITNEKRPGSTMVGVDPKIAMKKAGEFNRKQETSNTKPNKIDYAHWLNINLE